MPEAVRQPLIEFTARTTVSTSMSVPSPSGDNSRTKLWTICSVVAQRGSTFHVVVNVSQTRAEVSELIHSFPQALRLFLRQRPDEEFDLHQIEQVLQDCVDLIRETAEAGRISASATLENSITAFVACATAARQQPQHSREATARWMTTRAERLRALSQRGPRVQSVKRPCSGTVMRNDWKSVLFARCHNRQQS